MADDSADAPCEASTFNPTATQVTNNGSTSGSITVSEPFAGTSFKMVAVHLSALNGTAGCSFPVAFANAPHEVDGLGLATLISSTAAVFTGSGTTADVILVGY